MQYRTACSGLFRMQYKKLCSNCIFPRFLILDLSNFIAEIIDMPWFLTSFPVSLAFIVKFYKGIEALLNSNQSLITTESSKNIYFDIFVCLNKRKDINFLIKNSCSSIPSFLFLQLWGQSLLSPNILFILRSVQFLMFCGIAECKYGDLLFAYHLSIRYEKKCRISQGQSLECWC